MTLSLSLSPLDHLAREQNVPVANASYDDIKDLLGGALFLPLYKWMLDSGPVYMLPTGPSTNFLVISYPEGAKHVLRDYTLYNKGLVSEVFPRSCRTSLHYVVGTRFGERGE